MSVLATIKLIKRELYKEAVVFIKIGAFYNVYFNDAIIISFLLGYKMKILDGNVENCGFPESSLKNIKFLLKEKKIDYIVINDAHDYDDCERETFGEQNSYTKCCCEAAKFILRRKHIEDINRTLIENINSFEIDRILGEIDNVVMGLN